MVTSSGIVVDLDVKEVFIFAWMIADFRVVVAAVVLREAILQKAVQTTACFLRMKPFPGFVFWGFAVFAVEAMAWYQTADTTHVSWDIWRKQVVVLVAAGALLLNFNDGGCSDGLIALCGDPSYSHLGNLVKHGIFKNGVRCFVLSFKWYSSLQKRSQCLLYLTFGR